MRTGHYYDHGERFKRIPFSELYVLQMVEEYESEYKMFLCIKDIAEKSGHTQRRISQIVEALVKRGLLEKIPKFNPEDERRVYFFSSDLKYRFNMDDFTYYRREAFLRLLKEKSGI